MPAHRFPRKYSDAQRDAITKRVLDDDIPARQAVEEAARGELGLPAFKMNLKTARSYIQRERRMHPRLKDKDAEAARAEVRRRLVKLQERELMRLERRMQNEPETDRDLASRQAAIREAIRTQRELDVLSAPVKPTQNGNGSANGNGYVERTPAPFMEQLAQQDKRKRRVAKTRREPTSLHGTAAVHAQASELAASPSSSDD